jgi:hypothetical protein
MTCDKALLQSSSQILILAVTGVIKTLRCQLPHPRQASIPFDRIRTFPSPEQPAPSPLRHCVQDSLPKHFELTVNRKLPRLIALACASLLLSAGALAAESGLNGLLSNSPFGGTASRPADGGKSPLEFRGVMMEGDTYFFSLHTTADSRSQWLRLNQQSTRDITPTSYDVEKRQLTVTYQGQSMVLALSASQRPAGPTTTKAAAPPVTTPASTEKTVSPTDEAERLAKIADEIRRRRALRQQAIQNK